jgi:TonB family protein
MLVWTTRTFSALTLRALFYGALFLVVVVVHVALTTAMRAHGWNGGASLFASGAVVLVLVLLLTNFGDWLRARRAAAREMLRVRQGLPAGPCCVVWKKAEGEAESDMPWDLVGHLRARYPKLARRLGVEGVAVVDFEINAEGAAKNIHCVYAWPSDVFFDAAREAMAHAKFSPKPDTHPRFGASFRMPFVFRISGAARLKDSGRRARTLRPGLHAAQQAVEKLRKSA